MRLNKSVVSFYALVYLIFTGNLSAQDQPAAPEIKKESEKSVSILLQRAGTASITAENRWIPALLEAGLEFKFLAINSLELISLDVVSREVNGHSNLQQVPSDAEYRKVGKKLNADYVVSQKFELTKDKMVDYYAEITSVNDGKLFKTVEKTFKIENFGVALDELVGLYMLELSIAQPKELARFLRLPSMGVNPKSVTALGGLITKERFETGVDTAQLVTDYRMFCEKDRSMLLGYYRAGLFFETTGKFSDASEALNILFMTIPEYTPVYTPLARNFRKNKRYEDAIRIANLGLKRGIKSSELSSELAHAYNAMGKKSEADAVFRSILENNPDDPFALLFNARKLNDQGKSEDALRLGDRLLKFNAERGWAQVERGRSLMALGRKDEAIVALNEATTLLPSETDPVLRLGDLYKAAGQFQRALQQYEKILKKSTDNVALYISAADLAKKSGDLKKALSLLYTIESKFSNHGQLQKEIGLLELATGDSSKARVHLEAGVRGGAEDEFVLTSLGLLYVKNKDYDKALTTLSKALIVATDKDPVRSGLIVVYLKKGDANSATSMLESMKSGQVSIPNLNKMLGDAFMEKKLNDKALLYYRKEIAAGKNDTALQSLISDLSYNSESPLNAKNEYLKLVKMNAGGAMALYRLAMLSLRLKDPGSADMFLDRAKLLGSTDANTWNQIGIEYTGLGSTSSAINAFTESLQKDPNMESSAIELATLLQKSGKDSASAEVYLKLYEMNTTKNSEYLLLAAQLFDKSGAKAKAIKTYKSASDKNALDTKGTVRLAELEFEKGDFQRVISLLETLSPASVKVKEAKMLAESCFKLGKFDKALPQLTFLQGQNPKDPRTMELTARIQDTLGNFEEAVKAYSRYLTIEGKHAGYAFRTGELYEKLKNNVLAVSQYTDNIRLYPEDYRNYDRLARLYVELDKMSSAVPLLKKAVTFREAKSDLNGLLARALASQEGGSSEAVSRFKTHLETNKNDFDSWVQLGNLYFSQKKISEAATAFEKAVAIKNTDLTVLKKLGSCYVSLKKFNEAIDILTRARNLQQGDIEIVSMLAECFRVSGATKNLIDVLIELANNDKKSFDIRVELGSLLVKDGRVHDAISVLEAAALLRKCQVELHLQLARLYEQLKNDERWLQQINVATACSPRDAGLNMELGRYYFNKKEFIKSESYLKKALLTDPKLHEANYLVGMLLQDQKKSTDAQIYLQKAIQFAPENVDYRVTYADLLYKGGKAADALKIIKPIISKPDFPNTALPVAGLIYKAAGNGDTARLILDNAIGLNSSCGECHAALGDLHFSNLNFSDAARSYEKAVSLGVFNDEMAGRLAHAYIKLSKYDPAQKLLEKIVQNSPQNSEAIYRLCHLYIAGRQFSSIRKLMGASTTPKNGWYFLIEGELNEVEGKIGPATIAYTKAVKQLPNVPEVQAGCGRINLIQKKYTNAITYLGQAMAGDPDNVQLFMDLGKAYEGSGDLSTAMELYKDVETRMRDHPEVHYYMARIYSKNNNHDGAIDALLRGIERNKKNVLLYMALGHEYRVLKQTDKAIDAYLRATKVDEAKAYDGYKYIGNIYSSTNDEKKAKKYYEMYINAGGQDPEIKKLLK